MTTIVTTEESNSQPSTDSAAVVAGQAAATADIAREEVQEVEAAIDAIESQLDEQIEVTESWQQLIMATLSSVQEQLSKVPTMENIATIMTIMEAMENKILSIQGQQTPPTSLEPIAENPSPPLPNPEEKKEGEEGHVNPIVEALIEAPANAQASPAVIWL